MIKDWVGRIGRGLQKPPEIIIWYVFHMLSNYLEQFRGPLRAGRFNKSNLLKITEFNDFDKLWVYLAQRPYPALGEGQDISNYDIVCPGDRERIMRAADEAMEHRVNLLGSGPVDLGEKIDWSKDYKTGIAWKQAYFRKINYNNPDLPSDVKFPWEVSRMQWLIPVGQAFLLTHEERYAVAVREVLDDWIDNNPYACSVNWACTMEAAMRILTWTWFFHVFYQSRAWAETDFRIRFLCSLYLHGDFTRRHLERSDINGNHFTANAAGLVFAGLFFCKGKASKYWQCLGWKILKNEISRQVYLDGVDFEASLAYHRLVMELFLLPALYRELLGLNIPETYRERLIAMARFIASYSRNDGSTPLWGDADDARPLPFAGQNQINDHRGLIGSVGAAWGVPELIQIFSGPRTEVFWLLGTNAAQSLPDTETPLLTIKSQGFPEGGFYVMRNDRDHVFIDCGPVGLAGRGGHGHNDCLSFEAVLDGVHLINDCGAYVYTASYSERNLFRSTSYHNTPQIDGEEINRFVHPGDLWRLHNDAIPNVRKWETSFTRDIFVGSHTGYQRLKNPVTPERTIVLDHQSHSLVVEDRFEGEGEHGIKIPMHLAPGVNVQIIDACSLLLSSQKQDFLLNWSDIQDWKLSLEPGRVSFRYGIVTATTRLLWQRAGTLNKCLSLSIRASNIK